METEQITETFDELVKEAERLREQVDPKQAIPLLERALKIATPKQLGHAYGQLGLCYEHLGNYNLALQNYRFKAAACQEAGDLYGRLQADRHMLSLLVLQGEHFKAIRIGENIAEYLAGMEKLPADAVWMMHGLVKALVAAGSPRDIVRKWTRVEVTYLRYAYKVEKTKMRVRVWTIGCLMDIAYGWAPLGWLVLPFALVLAVYGKLGRRLDQMTSGKVKL